MTHNESMKSYSNQCLKCSEFAECQQYALFYFSPASDFDKSQAKHSAQ